MFPSKEGGSCRTSNICKKTFKAGHTIKSLRNYVGTKRNLRGNSNDLNTTLSLLWRGISLQIPHYNACNVRLTFSICDFNERQDIRCFRIHLKPFFKVMIRAKACVPTCEEGTSDL